MPTRRPHHTRLTKKELDEALADLTTEDILVLLELRADARARMPAPAAHAYAAEQFLRWRAARDARDGDGRAHLHEPILRRQRHLYFRGCVNPQHCTPEAHGHSIMFDICRCGAVMHTNHNKTFRETTGWVYVEVPRDPAAHLESCQRLGERWFCGGDCPYFRIVDLAAVRS